MKKHLVLSSIITLIVVIGLSTSVRAADASVLQDKITNAQNGSTVVLEDNYNGNIIIASDKKIILDLNGKTLTGATTGHTIEILLGGQLTIEGPGEIINNSDDAAIFNSGTTTINGGIIRKTTKKYYNIANHGIMEFNNGTVINEVKYVAGENHASLFENGYYNYGSTNPHDGYVEGINHKNPKLTINNGTFDGGLNTIKNDDGAIIVINNGIFKNQIQVALFNVNDATINGGTFLVPLGEDKTTLFNRKYDDKQDIGKLTINNGSFNAEYFIESSSAMEGNVTVNGGTINTTKGIVNPKNPNGTDRPDVKMLIKGGVFNQQPESERIATGYIVEKTSDDKYLVKKNEVVFTVAKTDDTATETNKIIIPQEEQQKVNEIFKEVIENNQEIKDALDAGSKVEIEVVLNEVKDTEEVKKEKEAINDFVKDEEDTKIEKYFDLSLLIKVNEQEIGKITEPSKKITFQLEISNDLVKEGRTFFILRNHDGKVERIEAKLEGNKLKFETDKFSTYALAYEDKAVVNTEAKDETPKTGVIDKIGYILGIAVVSVAGIVILKKKVY